MHAFTERERQREREREREYIYVLLRRIFPHLGHQLRGHQRDVYSVVVMHASHVASLEVTTPNGFTVAGQSTHRIEELLLQL